MGQKRTRYAIVGTGSRARMFANPLVSTYREDGELVGLCDTNPHRLRVWQDDLQNDHGYGEVPAYAAEDFDKMVKEQKVDTVIVCTVDAYHHEYVIRAMELGCDAITEKPMTTDDEKCRAIYDAIERTGRKCRVTFNVRWGPSATLVKRLISEGTIGEILHVDMEYLLNTSHGADYFRRWHRDKAQSGGLMLHKSTHHFDLVNWWIDAVPETIFGFGRLAFYGKENAQRRGMDVRYERYHGADTSGDPFALDMNKRPDLRRLYFDGEKHDGYQRDKNVFGDGVTSEDSMSVLVKYRTGVVLNYALNCYLPREGYHIVLNGTGGRLEYHMSGQTHYIDEDGELTLAPSGCHNSRIVVHPLFGRPYEVTMPQGKGGHGGSDPELVNRIFARKPKPDHYHRNAGHGQGAASILIGVGANHSFETGQPVQVREMCPQLGDAARLHELP